MNYDCKETKENYNFDDLIWGVMNIYEADEEITPFIVIELETDDDEELNTLEVEINENSLTKLVFREDIIYEINLN